MTSEQLTTAKELGLIHPHINLTKRRRLVELINEQLISKDMAHRDYSLQKMFSRIDFDLTGVGEVEGFEARSS